MSPSVLSCANGFSEIAVTSDQDGGVVCLRLGQPHQVERNERVDALLVTFRAKPEVSLKLAHKPIRVDAEVLGCHLERPAGRTFPR